MPAYMVRINHVSEFATMEDALVSLEAAGMRIDRTYSFVPLTPSATAVLIRGTAAETDAEAINRSPQFDVFPDIEIGPNTNRRSEP